VKNIAELMQTEVEIENEPGRLRPGKSEVERLWADNSKAKRLLGWEPAYGGIEGLKRGLRETIDWFCDADNIKNYRSDVYNL